MKRMIRARGKTESTQRKAAAFWDRPVLLKHPQFADPLIHRLQGRDPTRKKWGARDGRGEGTGWPFAFPCLPGSPFHSDHLFLFAGAVKFHCPPNRPFRCKNDRVCLWIGRQCDGVDNCGDGTDELYCGECLRPPRSLEAARICANLLTRSRQFC